MFTVFREQHPVGTLRYAGCGIDRAGSVLSQVEPFVLAWAEAVLTAAAVTQEAWVSYHGVRWGIRFTSGVPVLVARRVQPKADGATVAGSEPAPAPPVVQEPPKELELNACNVTTLEKVMRLQEKGKPIPAELLAELGVTA